MGGFVSPMIKKHNVCMTIEGEKNIIFGILADSYKCNLISYNVFDRRHFRGDDIL